MYSEDRKRLTGALVERLYGSDLEWLEGGRLVGLPENDNSPPRAADRGLGGQRGLRFR